MAATPHRASSFQWPALSSIGCSPPANIHPPVPWRWPSTCHPPEWLWHRSEPLHLPMSFSVVSTESTSPQLLLPQKEYVSFFRTQEKCPRFHFWFWYQLVGALRLASPLRVSIHLLGLKDLPSAHFLGYPNLLPFLSLVTSLPPFFPILQTVSSLTVMC